MFFSFLKPILANVENYIGDDYKGENRKLKAEDKLTVFDKYFDKKDFLDDFTGSKSYEFIVGLVDGSPFQHFCDDFFSEEFTNYKMFQGILEPPTD